jgi:Myb-like DNA-binding domain
LFPGRKPLNVENNINSIMPKTEEALNSGTFTEEEVELFNEGLKKFGQNYKKIADHIGTRSADQVMRKVIYNRNRTGVLFSPPPKSSKKKRLSEAAETPSKKVKTSAPSAAAAAASATKKVTSPKKAPVSTPASTAKAGRTRSTRKTTPIKKKKAEKDEKPEDESSEEEEEEVTVEKMEEDIEVVEGGGYVATMLSPKVAEIVGKEEVQAVLAGFAGFFVAFLVKKFLLS